MATCSRKRFKKSKVCAGDLRHRTDIVTRVLGTPAPGTSTPSYTLNVLAGNVPTGIETFTGTARFSGVNIEDIRTHAFTYRAKAVPQLLEAGNNFIRNKGRLFRILRVEDADEDGEYITAHCTERGVDTQAAAEA